MFKIFAKLDLINQKKIFLFWNIKIFNIFIQSRGIF